MATHIDRPSSSSTNASPPSQVMARFWRAMQHLFGLRWNQNYGQEPSPLWAAEIDRLSAEQIATAYRRLLKSGASHPPTLPEFLELARKPTSVADTYVAPPNCAQFELAVNNWFLSRSVQFRFCGIDNPNFEVRMSRNGDDIAGTPRPTLELIRERAMEISRMHTMLADDVDPAATNERLVHQLDEMAESIYPASAAELWIAANQKPIDPKYLG